MRLAGGSGFPDPEGKSVYFWCSFSSAERISFETVEAWAGSEPVFVNEPRSDWRKDDYLLAFSKVREALRRGESYQVNLTFRYRGDFFRPGLVWDSRAALRAWLSLLEGGQGRYGCFADLGGSWLLSLSPELFWKRQNGTVVCRPMKGTAARAFPAEIDALARSELETSQKVRAENLMIVDMVRNDLGRVAVPGSVRAPRLFDIEGYPTVWQMTSTVEAEVDSGISSLWNALFPSASITGAPKPRTRELIHTIENEPREWYCGSAGWVLNGVETFNVLIRTLEVKGDGSWVAGTGGGVVWDSSPDSEWDEAWQKTRFLRVLRRDFGFVEALLWEPAGWFLLERHLLRLKKSVQAFREAWDDEPIKKRLEDIDRRLRGEAPGRWKVRLVLDPDGELQDTAQRLAEKDSRPYLTVALARAPFGPESLPFRLHKTTRREVYDLARIPGVDQTVHYNERGELTETTTMNLFLRFRDRWLTPAFSCGLLPGTLRAEALERGEVEEAILPLQSLFAADEIKLVNSVRGFVSGSLGKP